MKKPNFQLEIKTEDIKNKEEVFKVLNSEQWDEIKQILTKVKDTLELYNIRKKYFHFSENFYYLHCSE